MSSSVFEPAEEDVRAVSWEGEGEEEDGTSAVCKGGFVGIEAALPLLSEDIAIVAVRCWYFVPESFCPDFLSRALFVNFLSSYHHQELFNNRRKKKSSSANSASP